MLCASRGEVLIKRLSIGAILKRIAPAALVDSLIADNAEGDVGFTRSHFREKFDDLEFCPCDDGH